MRVQDLMTVNVVTVRSDAPLKGAAALLAEHRVSGLPVVDDDGRVLGVLSEADVVLKETGCEEWHGFFERLIAASPSRVDLKLAARTVGEAMSAPAVTIGPRRPVTDAATKMIQEGVGRLPVTDDAERLVGIITRADLVRAFVRTDAEIEREIREDVFRRTLWLEPDAVQIEVAGGEVRLSGVVETKTDAELIPTFVQRVPGVVAVLSKLRWCEENGHRRLRAGSAVGLPR
jgi:CBS domain-containing protein